MASANIIKLVLQSVSQGSGFDDVAKKARESVGNICLCVFFFLFSFKGVQGDFSFSPSFSDSMRFSLLE